MHSKIRLSLTVCVALISGALAMTTATAAQKKDDQRPVQKTRQAQAVSKAVYDKITKAQEKVDEKDYAGALRLLENLYNPDKLTEYEQANVLNYIGFVYYNMDDIDNAIRIYELMLRIETLEEQTRKSTTYTLAQLFTMEEQYSRALTTLDKWFLLETNPAPEPFILKAQNLYQVKRYKEMIKPIENAMQVARNRSRPVKEDWYVLLNFAYFSDENYYKVRDIQKILLESWPKKNYWFSLAGAFTELGEDNNLINAYGAAHTQGMLGKESELVTMAQLFLQREVPYAAAKLIEKEMAAGRVAKNAKNYRLLSQAWTLAMEDEKSIPALTAAAQLTDDGELDLRLGNAYLNTSQYSDCATSVRTALRKGKLKSIDYAQISLGMCLYNLRQYTSAIKSFRVASRTSRSKRTANQWISVINADIARNKQIRMAEEAARKKRQELADKRARSTRTY
ncbi:MAG: hypothetical protein IIA07_04530 [Proteobacteria bacterium]|nr:hypothetical protein [Pseudomonadota bacterium]